MKWLGAGLIAAGISLGSFCFAQLPGTFSPVLQAPAVENCTANTQGGGTYSNVTALFHYDNNGSDSGPSGRNLTITGSSSYSSTQSKFGGFSYKTAATSYASLASVPAANSGDITFEQWIFFTGTPSSNPGLMGDTNTTWAWYYGTFTAGAMEVSNAPSSTARNSAQTLALNAWHHWAWVRASNVWTLYLDGVAQTMGGTNWTGSIGGSGTWQIGANTTLYFGANGYFDETRFSNMARYTSNFTPQTLAFCNN